MNKNKIIASTAVIVFVVAGLFTIGTSSVEAQEAPDFTLTDINGEQLSLSDYSGKVIILNFWATWCGPCKMEIPDFIDLQEKYGEDLVIIGVSLDQSGPKAVVPFAEKYEINYPVVYGSGKVVQDYGGVRGIPTTFIIDRDLNIQRKYVGYRDRSIFENDVLSLK
ncbi:MAG: TlpA family protein disulfide reductase [Candidatus Marinimicrobia bacterium]|nr:TlpA family protein disulfide reductase [Candidatus Neomarinimicrobiota bacterium]MCF7850819.1 TlpA family protein disulfide reductase [Candidatus Neomarinimicrobiota bacterium]MCF7905373.1 TlpA family protein disulfide reductase [Candidatus Neomarinimicrobiota bacterium]